MSELGSAVTNAQLAAELREEAEAPGSMAKSGLILAAQRLEAKGEISQKRLDAAIVAGCKADDGMDCNWPICECGHWPMVMESALKAFLEKEP